MQGQESLKAANVEPVRGRFWERDVLMWPPHTGSNVLLNGVRDKASLSEVPHRMHFYTSVIGSEDKRDEVGDNLWDLGFQPTVLQKVKSRP